ncbi:TIGR02679 family protein [Micromonospora sp. CPCC 205371]|nr:TIGR02679 family protein [Micromonospora sp. CPCC 205371]
MTGANSPLPPQLRTYLTVPSLNELWAAVRARLERNGRQITGVVAVDLDEIGADHLSGLLGRTVEPGLARRIKLTDLDAALRRSAAGQGLISIVEILNGRPVTDHAAAREQKQEQWSRVWQQLDAALAAAGLADAAWVPAWIAGLRRTGILTRAGADAADRALHHAVTALEILLPVAAEPSGTLELANLATRATGNAHGLDDTSLASVVLLRAAAHALGRPIPATTTDRRNLWLALGVATDTVSGTVLAWRLRPPGTDRWSQMMRDRAKLGLITHLTLHELDQAGAVDFAPPEQTVFVCENPQVLQAAAHAGIAQPVLCLSGNPASVGTRLLRALVASGNPIRYHGDFDWPGVAIAGRILTLGATPWRMSAADYRAAVARLDTDHAVALSGSPVPTDWDPALAAAMSKHMLAVHEEFVLPDLLVDLRSATPRA